MPRSGPAAQPWRRQRPTAFVGSEGPLAAPGLHTAWFRPKIASWCSLPRGRALRGGWWQPRPGGRQERCHAHGGAGRGWKTSLWCTPLGLSSPALPDPKSDDWVTTMKIYSERSGFPVPTIPLISWSLSEQAALTFCVPSCSSACRGSA